MAISTWHALAQWSAQRMVNCTVEGILLAVVAWLMLRLVPRQNAGTRFVMWMSALLAIAILPYIDGLARNPGAGDLVAAPVMLAERWAIYLFVLWAIVASALVGRLLFGMWQLRRLRNDATKVDLASLDPLPRATMSEFQSVRPVRVCVSDAVSVPTAIGFFRPAVVLPSWTLRELSSAELNSVLLHELAHLRRRDDWTNLLQKCVRAVFFFHPAVWWIESRLTLEREMACDEHVLAVTKNAPAYAECLVSLAEKNFMVRRAVLLGQAAVHRMRQCSLRIASILDHGTPGATHVARPAVGVMVVGSLACLLTLAHAPHLVAFRSDAPVSASQRAPQVSPEFGGESGPSMIVPAAWHSQELAETSQLTRKAKPSSARRIERKPKVQAAPFRRNGSPQVARAAWHSPSALDESAPTALLLVRQTEFYSDGSQVWSVSVYRIAVLRSVDRRAVDGNPKKSI